MNESLPRPRASKALWLDAAYELLISEGIDAVKVMSLAKRLNLTRTGFYWHFKDISELHAAMIDRWKTQNTGNLVARCRQDASGLCEALFNLMDCWLDPMLFDAPLDLAIRNWARVNPDLQVQLSEADNLRIKAVTDIFTRYGSSKEHADVRGLTVIYTQIGYISMQIKETRADRLARVQHYVELFAGIPPTEEEVAQFLNRHRLTGSGPHREMSAV
ncbi:TetR/AcrR family transcriptional regulator [Roseovarius sp. Pro17]|uniref:TetR/AcrR family transcriptional regulator n=1 Tax=Roseovarius sp. Pro17 TaxID=3108175 RepID=UPI002D784B55|nr:TetR/AcrR family transcriptional regulator [Roseovarius sp. Pro17]